MKNYFRRYFNPIYMGMGIPRHFDAGASGSGGGNPTPEETALLGKISSQVRDQLTAAGYTKPEEVTTIVTAAMKVYEGLNIAALKKIDETFDPKTVVAQVQNIASAVQKLQQNSVIGQAGKKLDAIAELFKNKKFMDRLEAHFNAKEAGQYMRIDAKGAAAIMTMDNTVPAEEIPEDILHSFSVEGFEKKRRPVEYIYDLANRRTVAKITQYKTWLEEGDEEGAFAIVVEGAVKPLMSKTLVRNTSEYKKAAGKTVYTEEFAKFRTEVYNILQDLFRDQVQRNYAKILTDALVLLAAGYVGTTLDGLYTSPTDYHAIGAVAAQLETLEFNPDLLILNPQDKWRIALQQDSTGQFFVTLPTMNVQGQVSMMSFRVLTTNRIDPGEFILGESGLYKIEDEPLSIRMGFGTTVTKDGANVTEVEDDFDHNRFRIIMELFFHAWISSTNTGSFVKSTFADVKEALTMEAV